MAKYTPMMEQYLAIKEEAKDAFLFFRLGDFYELFFEDAVLAARELEITLTGRGGGAEERIPMCGVPYHSADNYIARLVEKGYKVAICEQVENPAEAKGVVRREIVRIVTPGTVMDARSLSETANNYIASVLGDEQGYSLAACDLSTGELYVTRMTDSVQRLLDELNIYAPSEVLGDCALLEEIRSGSAAFLRTSVLTERTPGAAAGANLQPITAYFSDKQLAALPRGGRAVLELLMDYLQETQKRSLGHIKHIRVYEPDQYMMMDPFTRRNLELVETVRDRSKKGSLLWLLDKTVTAMGGRLLRKWIEQPLMHASQIEERLEAVDRLYNQLMLRDELKQSLKEVYDLERLTARIAYGSANARDLVALGCSLAQVPTLRGLCADSGSATLAALAERIDPCGDLQELIASTIVDEPPVSVRDGGMIRPGVSERLDQLREANTNGKQWLAELERQERERTGIKSLKIGYNKVFGYYIEVTKSNLSALEEGRYERKQTLANAERFVTPELKVKEALILEAQEGMVDLEYELFSQLREKLLAHLSRLQQLAGLIAAIDVYQSLAHVSAAQRYTRPQVGEFYGLEIEEGRHPVVEAVLEDGSFIANDTSLTREGGSMLLITGPNMAGKSTYMRQVAMISVMAQIGCFVPAKRAVVPIVDRIFTRIGAADDLIGGQSTFMVEMMDIQVMTEKATARSLVIIDELGRGTSTGEGMAIAQAVIEFLHDRIGCKTLVSTHFHELAHLEESLRDLRNGRMAVKESGQDVTFLRKLVPGAADTSYGIYCAQIAGLPGSIIERSYELLHAFEARAELGQSELQAAAAAEPRGGGRAAALAAEGETPAAEPRTELGAEATAVGGEPGAAEVRETAARGYSPAAAGSGAEAGDSTPAAASPEDGPAGRAVQLSLFPAEAAAPEKPSKKDARADKVLEQLRAADLMNMTPMTAMNLIYELKKQLAGS
ncbi:DNA mismatch repair protein MutS [Paenibacillus sp. UNCCL117]|uniref:DNA mismatch repair protein MutS n=1 Tax=unclassified Paenibacillus TaxID=185978 RepID=UPI00088F71E4|nr:MULTISPECIES: DNA mismatch repair protein MutS [unclassified Paenibacillus]SDC45534.1 DNA mismatch repair protein MutS [Paenibacillus sp. cl123]SFW12492.1 DNA mismatch repair protein MutS [Paenibacillus sp. UNCCL117]